jgi:hypothetical protein
MTIPYHIYIIFHKQLYKECYNGISKEFLESRCHFFGVNGKIQKRYDPWFQPMIIWEKDLPVYDPFLQYNRFCESSVLHHMYKNWNLLVEPYEYVGILQYDMRISPKTFLCMDTAIERAKGEGKADNLFFYFHVDMAYAHLGNCILNADGVNECLGFEGWNEIVQMYNYYFKTSHTIQEVAMTEIPLFHTFTLHKKVFGKIMTFAMKAIPRIFELLHHEVRHLPFHLERLMGILCYFQKKEGIMKEWICLPDVIHDEHIKDEEWEANMKKY